MNSSQNLHENEKIDHNEAFTIVLTPKQALFLSKILPLNYSLQPQKGKRGRKPSKKPEKGSKRSAISLSKQIKQIPSNQMKGNNKELPFHNEETDKNELKGEKLYRQFNEQTKSIEKDNPSQQTNVSKNKYEWMVQFIKACSILPPIKRAYGGILQALKQKIQQNSISFSDFNQAIFNEIQESLKKNTKREVQLGESLKKIYLKHKKKGQQTEISSILKTKSMKTIPEQEQNISKPSYQRKQVKKKEVLRKRKMGSQSSSDVGVDFDLNDYVHLKAKPWQFEDNGYINAAYISRNLRKIPTKESLKLLSKYGVNSIDLLKIKNLSKKNLQLLKCEVKELKGSYPMEISDSQQDRKEYVQSSFEVEDD